jgi:colanic acid/amylovoran biosynthesis glycosyltransferase
VVRPVEVWVDSFPVVSETFVVGEARALRALGHPVAVVATQRAERPAASINDLDVRYLEDCSPRERVRALARVIARHPLRCVADLVLRVRWRREEHVPPLRAIAPAIARLEASPSTRVHVHFAAGAALSALRANRILGREWSLTAHAYDIWQLPRNLRAKLRAARFVTTGCGYNVRELRSVIGAEREQDVHEVVMGVDLDAFRRSRPHAATGTVLGVGRLVEKKGFTHLLAAATGRERVVLVGDGPLRERLLAQARELGIAECVELRGAVEPAAIRALLEDVDVLAMPCVVAADGDRDSMPVVVKEALAMEVPVVVSDEVGLPEIARPEFARIVPPGDAAALAAAIAELLALTPEQRAAMGRAGRAFVAEHANVQIETEKLSRLLAALR